MTWDYLLLCRREVGAIEACQADGWRGASRDAVKQTVELERAQRQVRHCI